VFGYLIYAALFGGTDSIRDRAFGVLLPFRGVTGRAGALPTIQDKMTLMSVILAVIAKVFVVFRMLVSIAR
jgi:hypothetical protein